MSDEIQLHIIYLESRMLLTKKQYSGWREIQDEFADYRTSLGPWSVAAVLDFLRSEYPKHRPFSDEQVRSFLDSDDETIVA